MNRSEIWLVNLDPTIGDEIKKSRPAILANDDQVGRLKLRVVVPVTGWQEAFNSVAWMVRIDPDDQNNLTKTSAADAFQIRSVSTTRFVGKLGQVSIATMNQIADALIVTLGLYP
jgi:mRNA interferase MazF